MKVTVLNALLQLFAIIANVSEDGDSPSSQTLSDSDRLKRIAGEINKSLLQREKFIVFLRLIEFINEDDVMTLQELTFIKTGQLAY